MTRAEAIEYIQEWLKDEYALNGKDRVVLNMAIKALQQEPSCRNTRQVDLISRQDAIDALLSHFVLQTYTGEQVEQAKKLAEGIMSKVPSADRPKWIPISERLPEEEVDVIVTVKFLGLKLKDRNLGEDIKPSTYTEVARLIDGTFTSDSDEYKIAINRHIVTAWMPLPEPYEGE